MKNHGLNNTKHASELYYQLVNFQEKLKTVVLIVPKMKNHGLNSTHGMTKMKNHVQ